MRPNPYESPPSRSNRETRDANAKRTTKPLFWTVVVPSSLASVLLYVLSIGPALYLLNAGLLPKKPVEAFYTPLVWAAKQCDPLDYALKRYIAHWF